MKFLPDQDDEPIAKNEGQITEDLTNTIESTNLNFDRLNLVAEQQDIPVQSTGD